MSKRTRPIAFGVFVGIFLLSYLIGTTYKMGQEESQNFMKEFQSTTQGIDALGIFVHNASVSLPMFIPGFGVAWGTYSGWQTGAGFEAIISSNPALSAIQPLTLLLVTPFGVLELVSYSIAMSRSFLVIWRIAKRNPIKSQIEPSLIEVGIVIALLVIGGFVESYIIQQHASLSS